MISLRRLLQRILRLDTVAASHSTPQMPDLESFEYQLAVEPPGAKLRAWGKLRELERRLVVYRWAESINDPYQPQYRILLNDAVSAFLMTFEATVQFAKDQVPTPAGHSNFRNWLEAQSEHDIQVRGLRTLRHFEAHVDAYPAGRAAVAVDGAVSVTWRLPTLQPADLARLTTPVLSQADLPDWNSVVGSSNVTSIFEHGLLQLSRILQNVEKLA